MERQDGSGETRQFNILWAVVLSVLLHVLFVLLSVWFPLSQVATHAEDPQDITFTFANEAPADDPLFPQDLPPAPTEPRPQAEPDLIPRGPELADVDPAPTYEPAPPVPAVPPQRSDPVRPAEAQPPADEAEPTESEPRETPPPDPRAEFGTPPEGRRPERAERRLDVDRALQDFRRTRLVDPAPASNQGSGRKRNVFVPDLSQVPQSGFGVGNLVFESRDFDWEDYGRQVYIAIWRAWHNRLWLTSSDFEKWAHQSSEWMLDHQAHVRFVIQGNGQVTEISIESPSGCMPLDVSATDALAEVILPPLPAGFPRDREVVHAGFLARGEVRAMRPTLRYLRAQGRFGPAAAAPDR